MSEKSVFDLIDTFGCHLAAMEECIAMDPHDWEEYKLDPLPVVMDLLYDFGDFRGIATGDQRGVGENAARKFLGIDG